MREKSFDSINVVPFIDIMLVLLTIVLATATFIKTGAIPVRLPEAASGTERGEDPVVITISAEGEYYYENKKIDLEGIREVLAKLDPKSSSVSVWADKSAEIQPFASLMGILSSRGFEKVSLKTEIK